MEANEAMRRIFWRHRWLLIALLLIPVAAIVPLRMRLPVTYAATASIQAQAAPPVADTQVIAILSRVTTVATSPAVVQSAITAAGVNRRVLDVARHQVAVTSLSSSAVVRLTVTDRSRPVAIRLARSLAAGVVSELNGLGTQASQQLAALAAQRAQLDATRSKLLKQMAAAAANHEVSTSAGVQSLISQLNAVDTQTSTNLASVQQVLTSSSSNEGAGVISAPTYATGVSRHVAVYSALAGLLGLVVGLLIATIRELARPTIAAAAAGAKELSLVHLGDALLTRKQMTGLDDELTLRLDLAADRLGARTLVLTGPVPPAQLTALAAHVSESLPALTVPADGDGAAHADGRILGIRALSAHMPPQAGGAKSPAGSFSSMSVHPASIGSAWFRRLRVIALPAVKLLDRPEEPALVLVLPRFAPRAALDQAVDLGVITGWPLLGVIGLRRHRKRRRRAARLDRPVAEPSPPTTEPDPLIAEPAPQAAQPGPQMVPAAGPGPQTAQAAGPGPQMVLAAGPDPLTAVPDPERPAAAGDQAATGKKHHAGAAL